ncbi:BamA/TamA family outer membrane protein [Oscillatoria salina]|uniref:BamA/TamA family outer membrane protein n=1 Tax=Oscillatoria salina TaxID=331517 RepID=UPI001CC8FE73|nr:BamA/TamA family outer membrane protein [Oscillatoria salina]MBZ8182485.1 BamA/TamA family outer membrane protein [Oscillatoria salina IIICB1]
MQVYKLAIFTFAGLIIGEFAQQTYAVAEVQPANVTSAKDYIVPVETSSPSAEVSSSTAKPNTVVDTTPEFSQPKPKPSQGIGGEAPRSTIDDLVVRATNIRVVGGSKELQEIVLKEIRTQIGDSTSQTQLESDVTAILKTGLFADARVSSNSNQNGWDIVFEVEPIVVRSLKLSNAKVLPQDVAESFFQSQLGKEVSPTTLDRGVKALTQWYKDNGYILAQVSLVQPQPNGILNIEVAEGVIGDIQIRFLDKEGEPTDGRTRESFVREQLQIKPGEVFRLETVQDDLGNLYRTGLFQQADINLNGDANKVDITYNLIEAAARAINAGGGYNQTTGLFGTLNYNDRNFGGINQNISLDLKVGTRDFQFETSYGSPYRSSNPDNPGYEISAFRRRNASSTFDDEVNLPNGDRAREGKFGGSVTFAQPVGEWDGSLGLNYTRTSIRDSEGNLSPVDEQGNRLSYSENGIDDLVTIRAGLSQDERDNPINPTSGSRFQISSEQSIPVGSGSIFMNRLQASYSNYTKVNLLGQDSPEVLAFNIQGGTTIGDLPPYQAFNLGGLNSVRGYGSGEVASGRSYVLASAEYRFPIFDSPVGGVVFADFASDLGSGDTVPGEPGTARDKPGSGFGYGAGVRVNSPIGILRADFGINDQGSSKLQFGIGHRF